jgi:hypothetical protein
MLRVRAPCTGTTASVLQVALPQHVSLKPSRSLIPDLAAQIIHSFAEFDLGSTEINPKVFLFKSVVKDFKAENR